MVAQWDDMLLMSDVNVASLTTWPAASGKSTRMISSFFGPSVAVLWAVTHSRQPKT
jgi:hypothetical protein